MSREPRDHRLRRVLCGAGLLLISLSLAFNAAAATATAADTPTNNGRGAEHARAQIMAAYQKEYAFLVAQKRELAARLESFEQQASAEVAKTQQHIAALQDDLSALRANIERLQAQIADLERRLDTAHANADLLAATLQRARTTFAHYSLDFMDTKAFAERPRQRQLAIVFEHARGLLERLTSVHQEPGAFFTPDHGKVTGTLIHLGNIATYGIAPKAAGVLAPAGGGALKLWRKPASADARALAAGEAPAVLSMFLYEDLDQAVQFNKGGGVIAFIDSGGIIAWIIVALGALAVLLSVLRVILLARANRNTKRIVGDVRKPLEKHELDEALEACRRHKGSAAAVVAAALRSMHRSREALEDVVNESILHESMHLERFGSFILVIAAVAPLLGLLGTVTGMIQTFEMITRFGTGDPSLLSEGIAIALVTTELGLTVAIPTLLIGNMLSGWADRIKDDMQKATLRVTNIYQEAGVPRTAA